MALITCPDCAKQISDLAPACIHCGKPLANGDAKTGKLQCPRCDSSELQRLSVVHQFGAARISSSTTTTGTGISTGGIGAGIAFSKTQGIQQSQLSERVAPPVTKGFYDKGPGNYASKVMVSGGVGLGLAFIAIFVSDFALGAIMMLMGVGLILLIILPGIMIYNAQVWVTVL